MPYQNRMQALEAMRRDQPRRNQGLVPPYTGLECMHGPPGRYPPNNIWRKGRSNGHPETCPNGNPLGYHLDLDCMYPCPAMLPRHHPHRLPSRRGVRWERDIEVSDDDWEDGHSGRTSWSDIYDGASAITQLEHMQGHRMPRHNHGHGHGHGHRPWHPAHHGMGFHPSHGLHHLPRHAMHPRLAPHHGHGGDRVPGMFPRDIYRTGHGPRSLPSTESW